MVASFVIDRCRAGNIAEHAPRADMSLFIRQHERARPPCSHHKHSLATLGNPVISCVVDIRVGHKIADLFKFLNRRCQLLAFVDVTQPGHIFNHENDRPKGLDEPDEVEKVIAVLPVMKAHSLEIAPRFGEPLVSGNRERLAGRASNKNALERHFNMR